MLVRFKVAFWIFAVTGAWGCGAGENVAGGPAGLAPGSVCSSQSYSNADQGSQMQPGGACISCHAAQSVDTPITVAGTVYPTAHEPTTCDGVAALSVVITDANGAIVTLATNAVGSFLYGGAIALPFHAKVVSSSGERAMGAAQSTGDCNSCHTEAGANGAPGRIMAP